MSVKRKIRGIRTPIPKGYILGRASSGEGDVELLDVGSLAAIGVVTNAGLPTVIEANLPDVNADVGTFGDATHVAQITVDAKGRITAVTEVLISGGGGGSWIPAVTGSEPPVLVSDGAGNLILVAGP